MNDSLALNRSAIGLPALSRESFINTIFIFLMIFCNMGNIVAIIGIMSVHSKLFKIESLGLLLICIIHFICLILFTLQIQMCFLTTFGYILQVFHVFLLVMISFNRTRVVYLSFVQKRQVTVREKHKISLYNRYMTPAFIALGGFLTIFVAFYVPFLIKIEKRSAFSMNCVFELNPIYGLFLQSYTILFLNFLILINYLIVIPYFMIRYTNGSIRSHRSAINPIVRLFIYSLNNLIAFTLYAVVRIVERKHVQILEFELLSSISHIFYSLEPFVLLITHSKILAGLFKLFLKFKKFKI
jgi:hypothetical protein